MNRSHGDESRKLWLQTVPEVSILMPVHGGANPESLAEAIRSLVVQSFREAEIMVLIDGPLTESHHRVISLSAQAGARLRMLQFEKIGLAGVLQAGLMAATTPIVARMDADDLSVPTRLERQLQVFQSEQLDLLGSAMYEFEDNPSNVLGVRRMPTGHQEIRRQIRRTNPFNHPTVVMRREAALEAGGYRSVPGAEDYDLFARMIARGFRAGNMPDVLVFYRGGRAMISRRRGWDLVRGEWSLQSNLRAYGLIGPSRMALNLILRGGYRLLPGAVQRGAYQRLFLGEEPANGRR